MRSGPGIRGRIVSRHELAPSPPFSLTPGRGYGAHAAPHPVKRIRRRDSAHEPVAVVRRGEIELGAERHDAGRVHLALAAVIVPLDVIDVHGLGDARHLIEIAQIVRQVRIVDDAPQVALEVAVIDRVEADQRREQPPVGLGQARAGEIALPRQPPLQLVERRRTRRGTLPRRPPAWWRSPRDRRRC